MNSLVKYMVQGLINEEQEYTKTVGVYGGGFKPPTSGHFEVVKTALKENPNIDELIVFIGKKERDGITQDQSLLVWEIYNKYLPQKVTFLPSSVAPIKDVYNYAKNNPDTEVLWVIGAREGNQDDFRAMSNRTASITKYPNLELRTIVTTGGVSGTATRNAAKVGAEKLADFLPSELRPEEQQEVYNIVSQNLKESLQEQIENIEKELTPHIKSITQHIEDEGLTIKPYPKVKIISDDVENAKGVLGKTAYYEPNENVIVLYTYNRHPKDVLRSYAHELIHVYQNVEERLSPNISTTDVNEDDELEKLEREAYEKGNILFRSWTDKQTGNKLNEAVVGEKIECDNCDWSWNIVDGGDDLFMCHKCGYNNYPIPSKKNDPFGLIQYSRELAQGLEEELIKEGKYDSLTTYLTNKCIEAVKTALSKKTNFYKEGYFGDVKSLDAQVSMKKILGESYPILLLDVPNDIEKEFQKDIGVEFDFELKVIFVKGVDSIIRNGGASKGGFGKNDEWEQPQIAVEFVLDPYNFTRDFQELSSQISDVIRHEVEHLTQSGGNSNGKSFDKDSQFGGKFGTKEEEKFRKKIYDGVIKNGTSYLTIPSEIDANLQGLYLSAKKAKKPFGEVIDQYLYDFTKQFDNNGKPLLSKQDVEGVKKVWRSRLKALSLPLFEQKNMKQDWKIFLDMDGVLADFESHFEEIAGVSIEEFQGKYGHEAFWNLIDEDNKVKFWVDIPLMPGATDLVNYVKDYDYEVLTAPSVKKQSLIGKTIWMKRQTGKLFPKRVKVNFRAAKNKHKILPQLEKTDILIDDRQDTIDRWNQAGGTGVFHTSAPNSIAQLKKLGI